MSLTISIKQIKKTTMKVDAIRLEVLNALHAEAAVHRRELNKTTATWEGDKPTFQSIISTEGGNLQAITGPAGEGKGAQKWVWLNDGTKVRYATMSSDWQSKTKPKWFGSGGGRGRMLFVRKDRPRPGIKARGWSEALSLTRQNAFRKAIFDAINKGKDKMWVQEP